MTTFVFLLAVIGFAHIMVESEILAPFRAAVKSYFGDHSKLTYMVSCYQCMGFWCGLFLSIPYHLFNVNITGLPFIIDQFVCGCVSAFLSMVGAALITYLDTARS